MINQRNDWHTLVLRKELISWGKWAEILEWLSSHCEGRFRFTTNIIKFELKSDRLLFQLGYKK